MKFVPRPFVRFTEDEILGEIRRVVAANGNDVPPPSVFKGLSKVKLATVKSRFGGYEEAIARAGYPYVLKRIRYGKTYTRERVESDLRTVLAFTKGYEFSYGDYRKFGGLYSDKTVRSLMNSSGWEEVMRSIGARERLDVVQTTPYSARRAKLRDLSNNDLLDEIGKVWKSEGGRPKYREFSQKSTLGIRVFERRFGTWTKAIEAFCRRESAALQGRPGTNATEEILLAELRAVRRKRPNDLLTYDFYKLNGGSYSIGTFQAHFGSWTAAVGKVEAASGRDRKYSTDQLFDELQRVWEELGRQPTHQEMREKSSIYPDAYGSVFGSWAKALLAFCGDRNAEPDPMGQAEAEGDRAPCPEEPGNTTPDQESATDTEIKLSGVIPAPPAEVGENLILRKTPRRPSKRLRFLVLMRDGFQCRICGRSKEMDKVRIEVDHILAYTRGGETTLENLWTLCLDCNQGKSDLAIALDLFQSGESDRSAGLPSAVTADPPNSATH